MNLLEKAILVALDAHGGVLDKSGKPYILHPLRLMMAMDSEEAQITAVLHDVVEDSDVTIEELAQMGFSSDVLSALTLLTHDGERIDYAAYIAEIKGNPLAREVKLADLTHNMDPRRLPAPLTERDWQRLQQYRLAWEVLNGSN
jgi:GTP diphosphokinase / guanosine-3',5'-bis(diphosphate) 3'-diphosphatase